MDSYVLMFSSSNTYKFFMLEMSLYVTVGFFKQSNSQSRTHGVSLSCHHVIYVIRVFHHISLSSVTVCLTDWVWAGTEFKEANCVLGVMPQCLFSSSEGRTIYLQSSFSNQISSCHKCHRAIEMIFNI